MLVALLVVVVVLALLWELLGCSERRIDVTGILLLQFELMEV